jgi:hypothetical protein
MLKKHHAMKVENSLLGLLIAAMLPALPVQATPNQMKFTCTVTGQFQQGGDEVGVASSSEVIVGKLSSVVLTAKDLIKFAGDENETTYPSGSELLVVLGFFKPTTDGVSTQGSSGSKASVWVIDKNGEVLDDVTEYICVSFDFESLIYSGRIDFTNDTEDTRNRFPAKLRLRFPSKGICMTFRGNCTELYKLTAPNSQGEQRERGNLVFTGDGSGYFDERTWVGKVVAHMIGNILHNVKE